jgi:hypothetical protein
MWKRNSFFVPIFWEVNKADLSRWRRFFCVLWIFRGADFLWIFRGADFFVCAHEQSEQSVQPDF